MKNILICFFCLFFLIFFKIEAVFSQISDIGTSRSVAKNFYYERAKPIKNYSYDDLEIKETFAKSNGNMLMYYIFTLNKGGYVIISGTKSVIPVLAYSFDSPYLNDEKPGNFTAWMQYIERQIKYAVEKDIEPSTGITHEWERLKNLTPSDVKDFSKQKDVLPLISSRWNQGNYYNGMCPKDDNGPGDRAYAGCVATAMGQLMYYHRWPTTGTGSYSYSHPVYGTIEADFENTTYDWESMPNSITRPNKAIAELLFHLGVSVDMNYGPNGSGMWNHSAARSMRNYFKYCPETEYIFRDSTTLAWDSILIANLDQSKPLYYAGWTQEPLDSSGHAFVCDGYQGFDYFHFDWGWGGSFNGYFYLDQLIPGGADFNFRQEVIKDIYPDTLNYTYPLYCTGQKTLTDIAGSLDDGSGILNYENNSSCSWLIAPLLNVSNIKLTFDKLNTEQSNDIISIYNGETTSSPLLGTYSGTNIPSVITANGKKMLVTYTSNDSITADGFKATYNATTPIYCTALTTLTALSDTITDGSAQYSYNYLTNCRWRITPPAAENITINFVNFNLDKDVDYLEIYDIAHSPITLLDSYTGDSLPPSETYTTSSLMLWFKTNTYEPKSGWKLYYNASATGVNENEDNHVISVFPNPAHDFFNLIISGTNNSTSLLEIYSLDGKLIYKTLLDKHKQNHIIHTNNWDTGIYIIKRTQQNKIQHNKLLIY